MHIKVCSSTSTDGCRTTIKAFQGGQLQIEHKGQKVLYDWSNKVSTSIHWAAFYSDCAHSIAEVTEWHRITLTYNLFASERVGSIMRSFSNTDPTMSPVFHKLLHALKDPKFMPRGALLILPLHHSNYLSYKIIDVFYRWSSRISL